jgi:uncharacterized membrane protein
MRRTLTIAASVILTASILAIGGLNDGRDWGDVGHYEDIAERALDGELPYDDYFVEYPPGALPVFLLPTAFEDYRLAFKLQMVALSLATLLAMALVLEGVHGRAGVSLAPLAVFAAGPLVLGHLFLNRYDLWASALVTTALATLVRGRTTSTGALLGAAVAAKLFVVVALPVVVVDVVRTRGRRAAVALLATLGGVIAVAVAPFAAAAPGGVAYSLYSQAARGLHAESLAGSLLLALDAIGLHDAHLQAGLGIELGGRTADVLGVVSGVAQLAALAVVVTAYARGSDSPERLLTAFTASIVAVVAFAKVLSPQYLVWLLPLVPLVARQVAVPASLILLVACVASQLETYGFSGLTVADWSVALLVIRNLLLVALFGVLLRPLLARPEPG